MSDSELSIEPDSIRHLTDAQKERLSTLLEEYMNALEEGLPPLVEDLVAEDRALLLPLRSCVAGLENLHRMAADVATSEKQPPKSRADSRRQLGDFDLLEEIGRGGMGVVYRARQVSLDRIVALKLLPFAAMLDARHTARFHNEAQAAGSLQHPHVVPVYAVGCERGVHYYAMQFIDGESIDAVIATQRRLTLSPSRCDAHKAANRKTDFAECDWRTTVALGIQAANGLHAAHEFGIIHRDIKPSNLLLDRNGKLWITDFGLARIQCNDTLTQPGDIVGTMKYMSPEQARGELALVDGRSDIYSLGVTLYEMLGLRPAFDADSVPAMLCMLDEDTVPPLRRIRPELPRDLETVVAKAMAKNRDARYCTAHDFANDLQRVLDGEPTIARPPAPIDYVARWAVNHRNAVAMSMLVGLVGLIGLAISTALIVAEKNKTEEYAFRAVSNERLARGAVDRLGVQVAELLAEIPSAESVRRHLLRETLDYYIEFAQKAYDDPVLQQDLAIAYGKIGAFQGELGHDTEAIDALQESEGIFSRLSERAPHDHTVLLQWSISQNNLAEALHSDNRLDDAARWFGKAIEHQEELLSAASQADVRQNVSIELATTLNNLGLLLAEAGAARESENLFLRSISLLKENQTASPDDSSETEASSKTADAARLLANLQSNLGSILAKTSAPRAAEYSRNALAQQLELLRKDRSDANLTTEVISTLRVLGRAQTEQRQHHAAIETFERSIAFGEQLHQRWPDQTDYRRELSISWNCLGTALSACQRVDEAASAFQKAINYITPLERQFSDNAELQSLTAGMLNNLGFMHQQKGETEAAEESYREAIRRQKSAIELAPHVPRYRSYLAKQRHNLLSLHPVHERHVRKSTATMIGAFQEARDEKEDA